MNKWDAMMNPRILMILVAMKEALLDSFDMGVVYISSLNTDFRSPFQPFNKYTVFKGDIGTIRRKKTGRKWDRSRIEDFNS
jgi:hypothetical protein